MLIEISYALSLEPANQNLHLNFWSCQEKFCPPDSKTEIIEIYLPGFLCQEPSQQQSINLVGDFSLNPYLQLKLIPHTISKVSDITRHVIINLE